MSNSRDLPPFAYEADSVAFEQRWLEEIPGRVYELQTRIIPEQNILKYTHGAAWSFHNDEGKQVPGEFEKQEEVVTFHMSLQQNGELEKLTQLADDFARQMAGGMQRKMFQDVEEITKQTGNTFTWKKSEKNAPAVFLEMLQKTAFGVTPEGALSMPEFVNFDPAFLAELEAHLAANPDYRNQVDAIKAQKSAEAMAREAARKAKFQREP